MKIYFIACAFVFAACTEPASRVKSMEEVQGDTRANALQGPFRYGPVMSSLTGTIVATTFWGPPGYGEDTLNDLKEHVYLLELEKPIDVLADTSDEYNEGQSGITDLQLYSHHALKNDTGRRITLRGKLFGAITGHHFTKVLLEIE